MATTADLSLLMAWTWARRSGIAPDIGSVSLTILGTPLGDGLAYDLYVTMLASYNASNPPAGLAQRRRIITAANELAQWIDSYGTAEAAARGEEYPAATSAEAGFMSTEQVESLETTELLATDHEQRLNLLELLFFGD